MPRIKSQDQKPKRNKTSVISDMKRDAVYLERILSERANISLSVESNDSTISRFWNFASATVPGASHLNAYPQSRCQDYVGHCVSPPSIVACDGAGSSINSDLGSQLIARCTLDIFNTDFFMSELAECSNDHDIQRLSRFIIASLVSTLNGYASISRLPVDSLLTTLAAATVSRAGEVFWLAVGDSAVIIRDQEKFFCSFENKDGPENETCFLGSRHSDLSFRYGLYRPTKLLGLSCLTDGAIFGLVSGSTSQPGQALKVLFDKVVEGAIDSRFLQDFLASRELWDERHRDDRSIAIAAPSGTPPR